MSSKYSVTITKINEVYIKIECEPSLAAELYHHFSFQPLGYQYSPKYKARVWDGYIHLYNYNEKRLYAGLFQQLVEYLREHNHTYEIVDNGYYGRIDEETNIDKQYLIDYVKSLNIHAHGNKIEPRDFQIEAAYTAIRYKRLSIIANTAAGKSYIIYIITRYLMDHDITDKFLILFPNTGLIKQMFSDFEDYSSHNGFDVESLVHQIYSGQDKKSEKQIHLSTWHSIYKFPSSFYDQYSAVFVDECHNAQSDSFVKILENSREIQYRYGFTGTLSSKNKVHRLVVQGLLGQAMQFSTTSDAISRGDCADIQITCVVLDYADETKRANKKQKYAEEFSFICTHNRRNKFIKKLAMDLPGNTAIFFQHKEHGKEIYDLIKNDYEHVVYIDGDVKIEIREDIRKYIETTTGVIAVVSYGTTSTGWSVKNLHNGIFASPYKSETKVLQSVGRGLRLHDSKDVFNLYDIVDDLSWKDRKNYVLQHFSERLSYYIKDSLPYKIIRVNIE